jgi:hypothetical protein
MINDDCGAANCKSSLGQGQERKTVLDKVRLWAQKTILSDLLALLSATGLNMSW